MSVKVSSWVWHEAPQEIGGNELILLLALADVADDSGRCRFVDEESGLTYDALAAKVRVDRRTIERLIPKLRERGLVEHLRGVRGRPNGFSISVPWVHRSPDTLSGNRSSEAGDSPTVVQDSPTAVSLFPDTAGIRSYINVLNVTTRVERAARGTRIAEPFIVTAAMRGWAASEVPLVNVDACTRRFVDYWRAATKNATKLDWVATWRNWLRKDQADLAQRGGPKRTTVDHGRAVDEMLRAQESGQLQVTA